MDAAGRLALPGLWDMHVHFGGGEALVAENRNLLPLYVAHGITTVRDAAGDLSPSVLEWRAAVAAGTLPGPAIFTSGPKVEGINSVWPGDLEVGSEPDVRAALDALEAMRVDFVKITENTLTLAGTDAGFLNSFNYPGIGLHDELEILVRYGLTPQQALTASVISGPAFLGRAADFGAIATGKVADIVLLDANPLEDIRATRAIHGVVVRGRHHDRAALDALLAEAQARASAPASIMR